MILVHQISFSDFLFSSFDNAFMCGRIGNACFVIYLTKIVNLDQCYLISDKILTRLAGMLSRWHVHHYSCTEVVSLWRKFRQNGDISVLVKRTLRWRQNGRDGVSNHQPYDCLLNRYSHRNQRKHQGSASLAFVWGIHRGLVNSPHKWPVTRKSIPFDDVVMIKIFFIDFHMIVCDASEPILAHCDLNLLMFIAFIKW